MTTFEVNTDGLGRYAEDSISGQDPATRAGGGKKKKLSNTENQASDLALDIDSAKGSSFCVLEEANSFAGQEMDVRAPLLEEMLAAVVDNELCGILIIAKSEFISNHSNFNIWLIPVHDSVSNTANQD